MSSASSIPEVNNYIPGEFAFNNNINNAAHKTCRYTREEGDKG